MTHYIIETRDRDDYPIPYFLEEDEIDGELTQLIERSLYTGDQPDVMFIGRWDGGGKVAPLMLFKTRELPELDDFTDLYYELRDANLNVEREFIVRIDDREVRNEGKNILHDS